MIRFLQSNWQLAPHTAPPSPFWARGAARRLECVRIQERAMPQRPRQRPTTPHQHPPLVLSLAASKSAPSLGATSALLTSAAAPRRCARAAEMKGRGDARSACDERRAPRRLQAHRQARPPPHPPPPAPPGMRSPPPRRRPCGVGVG